MHDEDDTDDDLAYDVFHAVFLRRCVCRDMGEYIWSCKYKLEHRILVLKVIL